MAWYPSASRSVQGTNAGAYSGGPYKGVLHTTEGALAAGAIAAFRSSGSWPHFLVGPEGAIWQFIDTALAARALRNLGGGVETNRDSAIQIEIVGFAGQPTVHSKAQMDVLRQLMIWVETAHGVVPIGPGRPFATHYGQAGIRFDNTTWDSFAGWCGHCHVPENDHYDPGAIDLAALLVRGVKPMFDPALVLEPIVADLACPTGGAWLVASSGSIYAFAGAPYLGSPAGHDYFVGRKAARLELVDGKYRVIAESGEGYGPSF